MKSMMNSLSMAGVGVVQLELEIRTRRKNTHVQLAKYSAEAGIESRVLKKTTSINSSTVKTTGSKKKLVL